MSRSLGLIHFMMYDKIKTLDKMTAALLADHPERKARLDARMAPVSTDPLNELIDQDNIHGWLAAAIDRVEFRYFSAIESLPEEEVCAKLTDFGRAFCTKHVEQLKIVDAQGLFSLLNGLLLDGMPCDGGLTAHDDGGALVLRQTAPVHQAYAGAAKIDLDPAHSLDKTCDGGHDHEHHEIFDVQVHPASVRKEACGQGQPDLFHRVRLCLLRGAVEGAGWTVEPVGADGYRIARS